MQKEKLKCWETSTFNQVMDTLEEKLFWLHLGTLGCETDLGSLNRNKYWLSEQRGQVLSSQEVIWGSRSYSFSPSV